MNIEDLNFPPMPRGRIPNYIIEFLDNKPECYYVHALKQVDGKSVWLSKKELANK